MTVGIIGGTGPQGQGLAMRFAVAGVPIFIGSREKNKSSSIARYSFCALFLNQYSKCS